MRVKARPLRDADGRVTRAINVIEDITDLKQAEADAAAAGRGRPRRWPARSTTRRRCASVAWLAVPDARPTGAWSTSSASAASSASRSPTPTRRSRRLAARACRACVIDPSGTEGPAAVARTGRRELHPHVDEDAPARAPRVDPRHHELVTAARRARCGERADDRARPAARRDDAARSPTSGRDARAPSSSRCSRSSGGAPRSRSTRAQLYRQRSAIARTLQNSLLPPALPEIAGLETGARCTARPARAPTSAATSTTSSPSPRTSGSR